MPETEPRTPDPQGQDLPRVTASAIPGDEPAEHPTTRMPQARVADGPARLVRSGPARGPVRLLAPASASQDEGAGARRADRSDSGATGPDRRSRPRGSVLPPGQEGQSP